MKKVALLVLVVAALGGVSYPASAGSFSTDSNGVTTFSGSISNSVQDALFQNAGNPAALTAAIQLLLVNDPSLAADVIAEANLLSSTSPAAADAIAAGYGQAVQSLNGSNSAGATALRIASSNFTPNLQATYSVATNAPIGGGGGNGLGGRGGALGGGLMHRCFVLLMQLQTAVLLWP